jgi:hypothetical protein
LITNPDLLYDLMRSRQSAPQLQLGSDASGLAARSVFIQKRILLRRRLRYVALIAVPVLAALANVIPAHAGLS